MREGDLGIAKTNSCWTLPRRTNTLLASLHSVLINIRMRGLRSAPFEDLKTRTDFVAEMK